MMTNKPPATRIEAYNRAAKLVPGDFAAQHHKNTNELRVPVQVLRAAHRALPEVKSGVMATDFLQAALTRGSVMALALDWAPSDVYDAAKKLTNRLVQQGAINDTMLIP
jgi:hypothetical protein